ncbi:13636_t:CDS:1, partial [Cetraspora pellucida]
CANTGIEVEKDDPKGLEWYSERTEEGNSDGLLILNDPKEPANAKEEAPNIGIEVEKDDPKGLEWYSEKAEEGNSDGLLILDDPKEPFNAKEEAPNIGIEVEKDDPKALGRYSKKEDPARLNNEQIRMDYQRLTDIGPTTEGTNENK